MTSQPSKLLEYGNAARDPLGPRLRLALLVLYVGVVVLPFAVIMLLLHGIPIWVLGATLLAYAFAFLPAYYVDNWLFWGKGFHSPVVFVLQLLFVAGMLWPLLTLASAPRCWDSPRWRRAIVGYSIAFGVYALLAAWQMTRSWDLFLG